MLLTEIGIHAYGDDDFNFLFFGRDDFVTRFSLSFSEDGKNFTDYIHVSKSTSTVCHHDITITI